MPRNIKLGWELLTVTNSLAYYHTEFITTVFFIKQAHGFLVSTGPFEISIPSYDYSQHFVCGGDQDMTIMGIRYQVDEMYKIR